MIHSELMFYEIIKLYSSYTGEEQLDYEKLESAFYSLEELASNFFQISVEYVFEEELEKLEEQYGFLFNIDNEGVGFSIEDSELVRSEIYDHLNEEDTKFDVDLDIIIQNMSIYHDLGIPAPRQDYQEIFDCNATIIRNYAVLAEQESRTGKISLVSFFFLKSLVDYFMQSYGKLKYEDFPKLKVVFAYYNDLYLLDGDSDVINASWYVALFSENENQLKSLFYDRLFMLVNEEDQEYENEEDDEQYLEYMPDQENGDDDFSLDDIDAPENNFDEEDVFFQYYTHFLNQYLKGIDKGPVKDILTMKKYLLIAIHPNIENHFFINGSIDHLELPSINREDLRVDDFMFLYLTCEEVIGNFNYKDSQVNPNIYALMVISAIFIKCFLELCINEEALKNIINRISNSGFYQNSEYKLATSLVDDIIFKEKDLSLSI